MSTRKWFGAGWKLFKAGEHAHFGWLLLEYFLDLRGLLASFGVWALTFFGGSLNLSRSPFEVWLWSLFAGACVSVLYIGWCFRSSRQTKFDGEIASVADQPRPDVDARKAFFEILERSEWREQQIRTTDASQLVSNWLEVRLDTEIHKALRNSKLDSWGEESLPGTQTTPEKPIPPDVWDTVEISFDRSALPRTAAHFKGQTRLTLGPLAWIGVKFSSEQIFRLYPLRDSPSIDRIPCTELLQVATAFGWDFTSPNSLHLLDLQDAMRQGEIDGTLAIWGRRNKWTRAESLVRNEVLEKISSDHWKEFFVHLFAATDGDNFNVYSWASRPIDGAKFGDRGYVDLHVERAEAMSWLRRDAVPFKGRTQPKSSAT